MVSDLLFPILPKEGKVNPLEDKHRVEQVDKEARLRALEEDEKNMTAEEREARQQQKQKKKPGGKKAKQKNSEENEGPDEEGHLDIYV
ncbi:hypothetical protein [Lacimicrobium alkaliphilum]|uniref:Uncharacterized protein n=1 Tax=Lacimicrobium alkaliphilum TaxID=1526571 RepID=A0ABQ1RH17_9ALTE|nr:hypothetical protein [Lacimicrobium alkaliphilum]GGD67776.1 hypothetical protein GCM10011357_23610 [Lacimicrobium alkaliphilum]